MSMSTRCRPLLLFSMKTTPAVWSSSPGPPPAWRIETCHDQTHAKLRRASTLHSANSLQRSTHEFCCHARANAESEQTESHRSGATVEHGEEVSDLEALAHTCTRHPDLDSTHVGRIDLLAQGRSTPELLSRTMACRNVPACTRNTGMMLQRPLSPSLLAPSVDQPLAVLSRPEGGVNEHNTCFVSRVGLNHEQMGESPGSNAWWCLFTPPVDLAPVPCHLPTACRFSARRLATSPAGCCVE